MECILIRVSTVAHVISFIQLKPWLLVSEVKFMEFVFQADVSGDFSTSNFEHIYAHMVVFFPLTQLN